MWPYLQEEHSCDWDPRKWAESLESRPSVRSPDLLEKAQKSDYPPEVFFIPPSGPPTHTKHYKLGQCPDTACYGFLHLQITR